MVGITTKLKNEIADLLSENEILDSLDVGETVSVGDDWRIHNDGDGNLLFENSDTGQVIKHTDQGKVDADGISGGGGVGDSLDLDGTLTVADATTLEGATSVNADLDVAGDVSADGDADVDDLILETNGEPETPPEGKKAFFTAPDGTLKSKDSSGTVEDVDTSETVQQIREVQDAGSAVESDVGVIDFGDAVTVTSSTGGEVSISIEDSSIGSQELTEDQITVANNTVSLGGSTSVDHSDISNIGSDNHHTRYRNEEAQDAVGAILSSAFSYDDATPSISLSSDSVTITTGDGLKGGGSTALGDSVTINIEPGDFAGNALADDGSDNLAVQTDSIDTDEIDQSISPTWTSEHTFDSGISLAELESITFPDDSGAETLADIAVTGIPAEGTEQSVSLAVDGSNILKAYAESDGSGGVQNRRVDAISANLRLGDGQSIEDGTGDSRLSLDPNFTQLNNEEGTRGIQHSDYGLSLYANPSATVPFRLIDGEDDTNVLLYDTNPSAGVLRSPNAGMRVEGDGAAQEGSGVELLHYGDRGQVRDYDRENSAYQRLIIDGSPLDLRGRSGLIDMSSVSAALRIATGQTIQDGSGTTRMEIGDGYTQLQDADGSRAFAANRGDVNLYTPSESLFRVRDDAGAFNAFEYQSTPSSPGNVLFRNTGIAIRSDGTPDAGKSLEAVWLSDENRGRIYTYDRDNSAYESLQLSGSPLRLRGRGGLIDASFSPADFRLDTGNTLQSGEGNSRISFGASFTLINDETGGRGVAPDSNQVRLFAKSERPVAIRDDEGAFRAVEYSSDTTTGVFSVPKAVVQVGGETAPTGAGLELQYRDSENFGYIQPNDRANNSLGRLDLIADDIRFRASGGTVDISTDASDLRLGNGQAVTDESDNDRLAVDTGSTSVRDQAGDGRFVARSGSTSYVNVDSNSDFLIYDGQAAANAVRYNSRASTPGVLLLPNTGLAVRDNGNPSTGTSLEIKYDSVNGVGNITPYDRDDGQYERLKVEGDPLELRAVGDSFDVDLSYNSANINMDYPSTIRISRGDGRVSFSSQATTIKNGEGQRGFQAGTSGIKLFASSAENLLIRDAQSNTYAVEYISTPEVEGELRITNAKITSNYDGQLLDWSYGGAVFAGENGSSSSIDQFGKANVGLALGSVASNRSALLVFESPNDTTNAPYMRGSGGEVVVGDEAGNTTTLT